jgi:hypothetical protein
MPILANLGFGLGALAQLRIRHPDRLPQTRSALLLIFTAALLVIALIAITGLAPSVGLLGIAVFVGGFAGSVGVLIKAEAIAARQRLRETGAGQAIGAMNRAFFVALALLLLAPGVIPNTPRETHTEVSPTSWFLLVLAAAMAGACIVLRRLLPRQGAGIQTTARPSLDARIWWTATAAAANAASAAGPETGIVGMFVQLGAKHSVAWSSFALLAILPAGLAMRRWGRVIDVDNGRRAQLISLSVTLAGEALGAVSVAIHGTVGIIGLAASFAAIEFGTIATWSAAEAKAVADPTDIRAIDVVTAARVGARLPFVALAALGGAAGLLAIWTPSILLSLLALALAIWWLVHEPPTVTPAPPRRSHTHRRRRNV